MLIVSSCLELFYWQCRDGPIQYSRIYVHSVDVSGYQLDEEFGQHHYRPTTIVETCYVMEPLKFACR